MERMEGRKLIYRENEASQDAGCTHTHTQTEKHACTHHVQVCDKKCSIIHLLAGSLPSL